MIDFETFSKKYRCSISEKRVEIGHRHQRLISQKMYHVYIDIRKMMPFNPKTENDMLNCLTISDECSINAKRKAFDMCLSSGAFELARSF